MSGMGGMPGMGMPMFGCGAGMPGVLPFQQTPSNDPMVNEVRALLELHMINFDRASSAFENRLRDQMKKRSETWRHDLKMVGLELDNARNPPALLNTILRAMEEGQWNPLGKRGQRPETSDPMVVAVRQLVDKWDLEERFELKIMEQLKSRRESWRDDMIALEDELKDARHPPGLLMAKLNQMSQGHWEPKSKPGGPKPMSTDPVVIEVRLFMEKWLLEDIYEAQIVAALKTRKDSWQDDLSALNEEIADAKVKGSFIWAKIKEMADGKFVPRRSVQKREASGATTLAEKLRAGRSRSPHRK